MRRVMRKCGKLAEELGLARFGDGGWVAGDECEADRPVSRTMAEWTARDLYWRLILALTPRERERWHAIWLLVQGWTASGTA